MSVLAYLCLNSRVDLLFVELEKPATGVGVLVDTRKQTFVEVLKVRISLRETL